MEHSRIPMRGKTKDAEAEALLKLLRQEQEFHSRISIPQIQRKQPLPSIGGKPPDTLDEEASHDACSGVFISQMKTGISDRELCYSESQFLCNPKEGFYNNNTIPNSDIPSPKDVRRPSSYNWKKDSNNGIYCKFERQRSKTLPPLGPPSPREREMRPSRPPPSSPKLWDED